MNVSIIVIGDELLIGQVQDTNSGWIARHIAPYGWNVKSVQIVGDDKSQIIRAIDAAFAQSAVVLTTGGIGPTKDDITKNTLCEYFGGELYFNEEVYENVLDVVGKRHIKINELTKNQAIVPSSCKVIQNRVGTAPIMWFEKDSKVLVSMPGVPFETETMMATAVFPELLRCFNDGEYIEHRTFIVIDHTESALATKLEEFENGLPEYIHLAYLPSPGIVRLRLTTISNNKEIAAHEMEIHASKLSEILGKSIISFEDKPLAAILGEKLNAKGLTLSTAESCTGGNIAHKITEIAGSSSYFVGSVVSYCNEVKMNQLGVSASDLDTYGAVSQPVVEQMSRGVSKLLNTDCAMSTSGIAGPGGAVPGKPVGTVWMAAKFGDKLVSECKQFPGSRDRVIDRATTEVMLMLLRLLS